MNLNVFKKVFNILVLHVLHLLSRRILLIFLAMVAMLLKYVDEFLYARL